MLKLKIISLIGFYIILIRLNDVGTDLIGGNKMKENVFNIPEPFTGDVEKDSGLTKAWKSRCDEVIKKDAKDYGVETCIESEEDPVCFQEYVGMLQDIITAVESGESLDNIRITYCKTDWNKLNEKVREFENAHLPVRADKLKEIGSPEEEKAKSRSNGTIVLEDCMIKREFTVLDILKRIYTYLRVE